MDDETASAPPTDFRLRWGILQSFLIEDRRVRDVYARAERSRKAGWEFTV